MTHPLPLTALDAEGAIRAAAGAALGRGLILAAGLVLVAALALLALSALRRGSADDGGRGWTTALIPAAAGAAAVILLGGVVGALAAGRNRSIIEGTGALAGSAGTAIGAWALCAVALGALVLMLAVVGLRRTLPRAAWPAVLVASVAVVAGTAAAADLPRPDRQAETGIVLEHGVQGSVVLTPGAAGPNAVRVGLSGPADSLAPIREAVGREGATVELRDLVSGTTSEPVALTLSDQGDLRGEGLVAPAAGRWRVSVTFPDRTDPVIADLTLQANPAFRG